MQDSIQFLLAKYPIYKYTKNSISVRIVLAKQLPKSDENWLQKTQFRAKYIRTICLYAPIP